MTAFTYLRSCSKQEVLIALLLLLFLRGHMESRGTDFQLYLLIDCGRIYVQRITGESPGAARSPLSIHSFSPL